MTDEVEPQQRRFVNDSPAFLEQGRAQSSLRHELEDLFSAVESSMGALSARDADVIIELSMVPNRIVARRGAFATSFSWLGGRLGGISDGRLLVIEWSGIATELRGVFALKSATSSRETTYRPEAANAESWCWRAADPAGTTCSTRDLVGEWLR